MKSTMIAVVAVAASAGIALATPGTVQVRYDVAFRTGNGGEFRAIAQAGSPTNTFGQSPGVTGLHSENNVPAGQSGNGFFTFCLERNEFLVSSDTNYRYTVDDYAVTGANGGNVGNNFNYDTGYGVQNNTPRDYLSNNTKWLYYAFRNGLLSDYRYTGTNAQRAADGAELQAAIWSLEDTSAAPTGKGAGWLALAASANLLSNRPWIDQVRVLNIFTTTGSGVNERFSAYSQSQLTLQVSVVPLPAAALSGMAGMMGLAFIRRRTV